MLGGFSEASLKALAADGADFGAILLGPGMGQGDSLRMAHSAHEQSAFGRRQTYARASVDR